MAYDPHRYRHMETAAPEALVRQAVLVVLLLMLLVVLSVHLPGVFMELDQPANPAAPPGEPSHSWVFGPGAALVHLLGGALPGLLLLGFLLLAGLLLPFWDLSFRRRFAWRPIFSKIFVIFLAAWLGLLAYSFFLPSSRAGG